MQPNVPYVTSRLKLNSVYIRRTLTSPKGLLLGYIAHMLPVIHGDSLHIARILGPAGYITGPNTGRGPGLASAARQPATRDTR